MKTKHIFYLIVCIIFFFTKCNKNDKLYYMCLSEPFCQYNWQIAEIKEISRDTFVLQFESKKLYFSLFNKGIVSDKEQFATFLKEWMFEKISIQMSEYSNSNNSKYYSEYALLSQDNLFDRYIDNDGYVNTILITDEKLPSFLLRLQDFKILVDQEDYSGRLKIYSPSEALKGIRECKTNLPQSN